VNASGRAAWPEGWSGKGGSRAAAGGRPVWLGRTVATTAIHAEPGPRHPVVGSTIAVLPLFTSHTGLHPAAASVTPPFPTTPQAIAGATAASRTTLQENCLRTTGSLQVSNKFRYHAELQTGSRTRSRRSSTPECGPASTSAPPMSREPGSAEGRPLPQNHYFQPVRRHR